MTVVCGTNGVPPAAEGVEQGHRGLRNGPGLRAPALHSHQVPFALEVTYMITANENQEMEMESVTFYI